MKNKLLCVLIAIGIMINCFYVFAEDTLNYNITTSFENNEISQDLTVKIQYENCGNESISCTIKDKDGAIMYLIQGITDSNGNYQFVIPIKFTGEFVISVNIFSKNIKMDKPIKILSEDEYNLIISDFNNNDATVADCIATIKDNKEILGIDTKYFTPQMEQIICEQMLKNKGKYNIFNFNRLFEESIIYAYLFNSSNSDIVIEIIDYYDSYLKIKSQQYPLNIYKSYLEFDEPMKLSVIKQIKDENPNELEKVKDLFNNNVAFEAVLKLSNSKLDQFIIKNNDFLKFADYDKKSDVTKWEILKELRKQPSLDNIGNLTKAYENIVSIINKPTPSPTPTPTKKPSGGGSSGGGGSSIGGGTYDKPTPTPTPSLPPIINKDFKDINDAAWAKDAIEKLHLEGIVKGKTDTEFCPNDNITRAEFAKIMVIAFEFYNKELKCKFNDVNENDWSNSYVASAVESGIISGYSDNTFRGNENITREDMCLILYRALSIKKMVPNITNVKNTFTDYGLISSYARNSVLMLNNMNIISGKSENQFCPKDNSTRAEVCVLIYKSLFKGVE